MATRLVGTSSRSANSDVALRTVAMHTSGGSGRRFPAACDGNSTRSTAIPARVTSCVDGHEPRLVPPGAGAGREHEPDGPGLIMGP